MSATDGAHLGVKPSVMVAFLNGGPRPTRADEMAPGYLEAWIRAAPASPSEGPDGYDDAARIFASEVLTLLLDGTGADQPAMGVFGIMQARRPELDARCRHISLFQLGWAVNAARYLCELPPISNPGLMDLTGENAGETAFVAGAAIDVANGAVEGAVIYRDEPQP